MRRETERSTECNVPVANVGTLHVLGKGVDGEVPHIRINATRKSDINNKRLRKLMQGRIELKLSVPSAYLSALPVCLSV